MNHEIPARFQHSFLEEFVHDPTPCQLTAISMLTEYLFDPVENSLFLLNGYAGTGKTTLISAFVRALDSLRIKNTLLAPTGRAAKVLGSYAGKTSHTIHRYIYQVFTSNEGKTVIIPRQNKARDTVYIVDEVSMLAGFDNTDDPTHPFAGRNILDDLVAFVYSAENCRMVFIGDQAQLPPVGTTISPALDVRNLQTRFNLKIIQHSLLEVVRQHAGSGILFNATQIRNKIAENDLSVPFLTLFPHDVSISDGNDLLDELSGSFSRHDHYNAVIITRSNKRANLYNQEVRRRILYREHEIEGGDLMMVVKNNYFWLPENSPAGFIANGDLVQVLRVRNFEDRFGFRFADALVRLVDYPEEMELEVKILVDVVQSPTASLSREQQNALFAEVREEIASGHCDEGKGGGVSRNPWYNALQLKFAYALTCHKTQGGQWEKVFLDQGWLPEDKIDTEYLRWVYTAVTRATRKLYLTGFNDNYLKASDPDDASMPN
ncbi:MAG: AAA family ATPase [Bacteroidales bacterium]